MPRRKAAAHWVPVADLIPWEDNPRDNRNAVVPVAELIERFGWLGTVVRHQESGKLIAGHTRRLAALYLLQWKMVVIEDPLTKAPVVTWVERPDDEPWTLDDAPGPGMIPCRDRSLPDAQARAAAIADNKSNEIALWDEAGLRTQIEVLKTEIPDFTPGVIGFDVEGLDTLFDVASSSPSSSGSSSGNDDGLITFRFGEYTGKVDPKVYAAFVKEHDRIAAETGAVVLSDVLRLLLSSPAPGKPLEAAKP